MAMDMKNRAHSRWWLGVCVICGSIAAFGQTDAGNFRVPDVNEQGVLESLLIGEKARIVPGQPMRIEGLVIELYEADGETVKIRMTSPGCFWDTQTNVATSEESVAIAGKDFEITGVGYVYDSHSSRMKIRSRTRVIFRNLNFTRPVSAGGSSEPSSEPSPEPSPEPSDAP